MQLTNCSLSVLQCILDTFALSVLGREVPAVRYHAMPHRLLLRMAWESLPELYSCCIWGAGCGITHTGPCKECSISGAGASTSATLQQVTTACSAATEPLELAVMRAFKWPT